MYGVKIDSFLCVSHASYFHVMNIFPTTYNFLHLNFVMLPLPIMYVVIDQIVASYCTDALRRMMPTLYH